MISTDTWSILSAPEIEMRASPGRTEPHALDGRRAARRPARPPGDQDAGRDGECAVAFAISEEVNSPERRGTLDLLARVFEDEPPDLILLETLTLIRDPLTFETVEGLLATGPAGLAQLPSLSPRRLRRLRPALGPARGRPVRPGGDGASRSMGVGALLINCLPVDHVPGMLPWLRDFTDLPLGVYPNLGYLGRGRWRFDDRIGPEEYAALALEWREEGAQIIGGCCGDDAGAHRRRGCRARRHEAGPATLARGGPARPTGRRQRRRRSRGSTSGAALYPAAVSGAHRRAGRLRPDAGQLPPVEAPVRAPASARACTCLDVGCGCGILAVQLALNGATRVHAIDIDRNAVANTLANGFRNGVADRITGEDVDLYHWDPTEQFDLIVASLYQMPVDPYEEPTGHRPLDYWGRNLLDHFLRAAAPAARARAAARS